MGTEKGRKSTKGGEIEKTTWAGGGVRHAWGDGGLTGGVVRVGEGGLREAGKEKQT